MSDAPHPAFSVVADMEDDICNLRRIASLLRHIAEGPSQMDPGDLNPIAGLIHHMGVRLHDQFMDAFDALKLKP